MSRPSACVPPALDETQKSGSMRLTSLDSLRGLAALSVVLCHVLWLYRPNTLRVLSSPRVPDSHGPLSWVGRLPGTLLIESTPLHLAVAGHEAVILFYLLSGFVLYLSIESRTGQAYPEFLVRRCCRLYLPYLIAIGLAVGLNATVSTGHLPEMNDWINHTWQLPIDWREASKHLLMIGNFNTDLFLMPSWTLVHEMRISLVFPLLAALVIRGGGVLPGTIVALSLGGIALDAVFGRHGNYFITLHYAGLFLVGATLARERARCVRFYDSLSRRRRAVFILTAITLYVYGRAVSLLPSLPASAADLPIAAGCALIIVWSMTNPRLLGVAPVQWLGKVCYGLYLLHFTLFLASIHLLHRLMPLWAVVLIAIALSLAAAELFWRLIELPAIRLGRWMVARGVAARWSAVAGLPRASVRVEDGARTLEHGIPR
jgi:peptidoglycan/LPS O-acetylase OafA/YrhL